MIAKIISESSPEILQAEKVNVVTVARLGKEKGVDRALRMLAASYTLKEKIHYYIVGDGIQKPLLQQIIAEENLSSCVTLCGGKTNPYGYMKAADLLLPYILWVTFAGYLNVGVYLLN